MQANAVSLQTAFYSTMKKKIFLSMLLVWTSTP